MEQTIANSANLSVTSISEMINFSELFQYSLTGVMITDSENQIIYVNPSFEKMTGYFAYEVIGLNPAALYADQHTEDFYEVIWQSMQHSGNWQGEVWMRYKNGRFFPGILSVNRVVNEKTGDICQLGFFINSGLREPNEEYVQDEAPYDLLTGLANSAHMCRHLDRVLSVARVQSREIALLYIELSRFNAVNEICGYRAGEHVLDSFARILKSSVGDTDFVARVGGNKFVIILDVLSSPENAALEVAEKIFSSDSYPIEIDSFNFKVGCSIGVSTFPGSGKTINELIRAADLALCEAKQGGGGCLFNLTKT